MTPRLAKFAAALAVGLGIALSGTPASQAAGAGAAAALAPQAATQSVEQVNHRWDHNVRPIRPRGGGGIYFEFGPRYGGPRYYDGPRYQHRPRYHAPRYVPRHVRPAPVGAHVRWCSDRYRSYRAWDNSYQPYGGPRRQCRSPYL
jgi:hypothetical protein